MALVGLKYPVAAVVENYVRGVIPSGLKGFVIGKAITADKDIKFAHNPLYADDSIAEDELTVDSATIKFGVDEISTEVQAIMFGHKLTAATGSDPEKLRKGAGDNPPYLAVGYYKTRIKNNKKRYEATILYRVKFSPPTESAKTKEKTLTWGTMETEGTIECLEGFDRDLYEEVTTHDTEEGARAYLEEYFGLSAAASPAPSPAAAKTASK